MGNDLSIEEKRAKIKEVEAKLAPLRKDVEQYDKQIEVEKEKKRLAMVQEMEICIKIQKIIDKHYANQIWEFIDKKKASNEPPNSYTKEGLQSIIDRDVRFAKQMIGKTYMPPFTGMSVEFSYYQQVLSYDPKRFAYMPDDLVIKELFGYGPPKRLEFLLSVQYKDGQIIEVIGMGPFPHLQDSKDCLGWRVIHELEEGEPGEKNNNITGEPSAPNILA